MQQITSTFTFEQEYHTKIGFRKEHAIVKLVINYQAKSFDVTPGYGSVEQFKFISSGRTDYNMWLATIMAIGKAIEFANQELGFTPKPIEKA